MKLEKYEIFKISKKSKVSRSNNFFSFFYVYAENKNASHILRALQIHFVLHILQKETHMGIVCK